MPFSMTSYFLGVGTVVGALALGFGGGIVLTNTAIKDAPSAPSRVERAARSEPVPSPQVTEARAVAVPRAEASQVHSAVEPKPAEAQPVAETRVAEPVRQIDTTKSAEPVQQAEAPRAAEPPARKAEAPKPVDQPARQIEARQTDQPQIEQKQAEQRSAERDKRRAEARRIEREKRLAEQRKARALMAARRPQPVEIEERARPELAFQREEPQAAQGGLFEGLFGRPVADRD
jgi:hypothetical protein